MEHKQPHDQDNFINCYCDASYSKQAGGSVIGIKIGNCDIETIFLAGINNTAAEMRAVEICVKKVDIMYPNKMYPNKIVHIYTDCQKAMQVYAAQKSVVMHKMIGHMKRDLMNEHQIIFTTVDRAARKELRRIMNNNLI